MKGIVIALLVLFVSATSASPAWSHHHRHHSTHHHVAGRDNEGGKRHASNIVTVDTAAGAIRVAADYATRFKNLIADFVKAGYSPGHVGCFATGGHVRNSRHYLGQACDFDQGDRPHAPFMRSEAAAKIISKYGFTNGCSFSDCGHVGTDNIDHGHRYAARSHRHHAHYRHHKHYATT